MRLIALTLITVIPAMIIIVLSAVEQRRQGAEAAQEQALQWATMAAEQHSRQLDSVHQTLATLARLPEVRAPEEDVCPQLLQDILGPDPLFSTLVLTNTDGDVVCTPWPLEEPVSFADREWFQEVVRSRAPAVGEFQTGRITGRPVIPVGHPVFENRELVGVLSAGVDVTWLNSALDTSGFPPETRLTVLDRNGTIMLRHPEPGGWIGRRAPETSTVHALLATTDRATQRGVGLDGDDRLFAFLRMEGGDAFVSLSLPTSVAFADADRTLWRNLSFLAGALVLALVAAWGGGQLFIVRPVRDLLRATRRIAEGDYSSRLGPPYDSGELGGLARDFDSMAETLHARRRERDDFLASVEAARVRTERAYRLLAEVTSVLANSTDHQATIERAAQAAVPVLADGCLVHIFREAGQPRVAALAHREPKAEGALQQSEATHAGSGEYPLLPLLGAEQGFQARIIPDLMTAAQEAGVEHDPFVRLLAEMDVARVLVVPLRARDRLVGVMTLLGEKERHYGNEQMEVAEKLADACALAVDTARLYEEEQRSHEREREAREAEAAARLQVTSILESITDGFYALDRDWRFTYVNREAERLLRRRREGLIGRNVWEEFPETVNGSFSAVYHRALTEQTSVKVEEYFPAFKSWFEIHVFPRDNGLAVYFQDITDRKQAEEALREADRQKDEFLAMLAHELRNPLAAIHGAVSMNQGTDVLDPDTRWTWEVVDRQTRHMKRLLDDLLDIARITRGKITLRQERLDAADIMERAVETVRALMDERSHSLTVDPPHASVALSGDEDRLAQVMGNLLTNAGRYTPEGGRISFVAEATDTDVFFRVRDNGIGIPPESLPSLFEPFVQAANTRSGGLGLGLALARNLVQLHGGTIDVQSEGPGMGSEFVVRLPRLLEPEPGSPTEPTPLGAEAAEDAETRVLVVDDNPDLARLMAQLLQRAGYSVRTAPDGPTALEMSQAFRPQAVVLDIGLPGMSGLDVARELRQREETQNTRIVALSGYGQPQDVQQSREAGCDCHLVKPVDKQDLLAALRPQGHLSADEPHRASLEQ